MSNPQHARGRRWGAVVLSAGVLLVVALLALGLSTLAALNERNKRLERQAEALAQQVRDLGGVPREGPAGATGQPGLQGPAGPAGQRGEEGRTGGRGPAGTPGSSGPSGAPGASGASGQPGQDGAQGPQGESGAPGPRGEQGPQGERGEPGPSCPDGSHPETRTVLTAGGPQEAVICVKDGES